jgi:hypothetical protein
MTMRNQDIKDYWSGDSLIIRIRVVDDAGAPIDLSGAVIRYEIAQTAGKTALVSKSSADGAITTGAGAGTNDEIVIPILPADTAPLAHRDDGYYHECEVTDVAGNVYTVMAGTISLETDQVQ